MLFLLLPRLLVPDSAVFTVRERVMRLPCEYSHLTYNNTLLCALWRINSSRLGGRLLQFTSETDLMHSLLGECGTMYVRLT